jgi:hypothetical protein
MRRIRSATSGAVLAAWLGLGVLGCGKIVGLDRHWAEWRDWRGAASLDSESGPGQITLYWSTTSSPRWLANRWPGPGIHHVTVYQSTEGPHSEFRAILTTTREGRDSTTIRGLEEGRVCWFRVVAHAGEPDRPFLSNLVMTSPGPVWSPAVTSSIVASGAFSWSGASDYIAYTDASGASRRLRVVELESMTTIEVVANSSDLAAEDPAWHPFAGTIAYTHVPWVPSYWRESWIDLVSVGHGGIQRVTSGRVDWGPAWGGGRWLYFLRRTPGPADPPEIWRIDPTVPASEQRVTNDPGTDKSPPSVRTSDERIVYAARTSGGGARSLYWVDPSVGHPHALTSSAPWDDDRPAWSPDGRHVAFVSNRCGHEEIWSIDFESRSLRQLTRGPARESKRAGRWSPNGRHFAVLTWVYPQLRVGDAPLGSQMADALPRSGSMLGSTPEATTRSRSPAGRWSPRADRLDVAGTAGPPRR